MKLMNDSIQAIQDGYDHAVEMMERCGRDTQQYHYWDGKKTALKEVLRLIA